MLRTSSRVTLIRGVTAGRLSMNALTPHIRYIPLQLRTLLAAGGGLHNLTGKVKRACRLREKEGVRVAVDIEDDDEKERRKDDEEREAK